jgi:hypothetical protein
MCHTYTSCETFPLSMHSVNRMPEDIYLLDTLAHCVHRSDTGNLVDNGHPSNQEKKRFLFF